MLEYRKNWLSIIFETQFSSKIVLQECSVARGEGGLEVLQKFKIFKFFELGARKVTFSSRHILGHSKSMELTHWNWLTVPPKVTPRPNRCRSEGYIIRSWSYVVPGKIPGWQGRDPSRKSSRPVGLGVKGMHPEQIVIVSHCDSLSTAGKCRDHRSSFAFSIWSSK
jgi:hypothetical protein